MTITPLQTFQHQTDCPLTHNSLDHELPEHDCQAYLQFRVSSPQWAWCTALGMWLFAPSSKLLPRFALWGYPTPQRSLPGPTSTRVQMADEFLQHPATFLHCPHHPVIFSSRFHCSTTSCLRKSLKSPQTEKQTPVSKRCKTSADLHSVCACGEEKWIIGCCWRSMGIFF